MIKSKPPTQILIVEIKTIDDDGASFNTGQLDKMVIYQKANNEYHVYSGIKRIEAAIRQVIPRLGTNFSHRLLFDVQVFENEFEACLASIEEPQTTFRRRR